MLYKFSFFKIKYMRESSKKIFFFLNPFFFLPLVIYHTEHTSMILFLLIDKIGFVGTL